MNLSNSVWRIPLTHRQGLSVLTVAAVLWSGFVAAQPQLNQRFDPPAIAEDALTTLTFTIVNSDTEQNITGLRFNNPLPAGIQIAETANLKSTCDGLAGLSTEQNMLRVSDGRLSAGQQCEISFNVRATQRGSILSNSSELVSSAGRSNASSAGLSVETQRPNLSQSFEPAVIPRGASSRLTIAISHTGALTDASQVTMNERLPLGLIISDEIPATTTCRTGQLQAAAGADRFSLVNGVIPVGSSCEITVGVTAVNSGEFSVVSESMLSIFGDSGKAGAVLTVINPLISLSKLFSLETVAAGETIQLSVQVDNLSREDAATNIRFAENLNSILPGLTAVGLPIADVCGEGSVLTGQSQIVLDNGTLAPEGSCSFNVALAVPTAAAPGSYSAGATLISADIGSRNASETPLTDTFSVISAPTLSKSFSDELIAAGQTITLNYTVNNASQSDAATDISFNDVIGRDLVGTTILSLPADGFCGPESSLIEATSAEPLEALQLSMTGGELAAASSCSFDVQLSVPADTVNGVISSNSDAITAVVNSQPVTGLSASDTTLVVTGPELDLQFQPNPAIAGDTVIMTVSLAMDENAPDAASGITLSQDLGSLIPGATAVNLPASDPCGAGSSVSGGSVMTLSGGQLGPNTGCQFDVEISIPEAILPGRYTLLADAPAATVLGLPVTGSTALEQLDIATVSLDLSFSGPVHPGETVDLNFTINNASNSLSAQSLSFSDDLSFTLPGLVPVALPPSGVCGAGSSVTFNGTTLTFSGGTLSPSESCSFDVQLQVPRDTAFGEYPNVVTDLSGQINSASFSAPGAQNELTVIFKQAIFSAGFESDQ